MMFFNVPSMQKELMGIIQYFSKMFEDATGLPMMMQGQQGSAPETVGGMELLMDNASIVPRDIVRRLDDSITEPHIGRYYEYLMIHGEKDDEKGDFSIHARGSSALMERAAQDKFLLQLAQFVANPAFKIDPELYMEELLRSVRINPTRLKLSEEKIKAMANQPPPEDPRITAAKIMAKAGVDKVQEQGKVDAQHAMFEAKTTQEASLNGGSQPHEVAAAANIQREQIRAESSERVEMSRSNAEEARANKELMIAQQNGQFRIEEMKLEKELAILRYAHENQQTLDQVKADLAKTSIQEQTRQQLASAEIELARDQGNQDRSADLHKHNTSLIRDEVSTPDTP